MFVLQINIGSSTTTTWPLSRIRIEQCELIGLFVSSQLLTYPPLHFVVCQLWSWHANVIWFLAMYSFTRSCHLSFYRPRFRFPSTVICNIFLVASSLSRFCKCPTHIILFALRNSAIGYMCASFQMSTFLTWSSRVFPLAHPNSFQLCPTSSRPLSNYPTFCTIHHGWFYSRLVDFFFQCCWYVPVAHHPSRFPPFWPGNIYSVVDIFIGSSVGIEQWAQILRFHRLHLYFLNVDSLVFVWAWYILYFLLLTLSPWESNVSIHLSKLLLTSAPLLLGHPHTISPMVAPFRPLPVVHPWRE